MASSRPARLWASAPIAALFALVATVGLSCSLKLGNEPFACADGKTCPTGYACESNECVLDGHVGTVTRAVRLTYINRSEMYWFASPGGGATLVVNDGFSPGARGIYEVHVAESGKVSPVVKLLPFPQEQTVSSTVVALDDTHYGIVTMSFPNALSDGLNLTLHSLPRDGSAPPTDTVLHTDSYPYYGGYEPAYVGGRLHNDEVVFAFTNPGGGGSIQITRLKKDGTPVDKFSVPLPNGVLPLSGDCLLWQTADNRLMLRVGLDKIQVLTVDLDKRTANPLMPLTPLPMNSTPIFGFGDSVAYLETNADFTEATYSVRDLTGNLIASSPAQPFIDGLEPYTAVAYEEGALVAPISTDANFKTMDIAYVGADGSFTKVAGVPRPGDDRLYTARAFATQGKAYIAWTSFHDQLMDLWVGVSPLSGTP